MALTQVNSEGIKDGEVKNADMADDAVGIAELSATGTASNTTFLRGDNSWVAVSSTPEGEAIQSTTNSNEANTKFLRADGDGTCSWQTPTDTNTTYSVGNGGLTEINFTAADHTKLDGIAAGAEVNVQSDWNSSSGDNQILNKPTIPAAVGDATGVDFNDTVKARWGTDNDLEVVHSGSHATIKNITGNLNITNTGSNTIINSDNTTFQSGDQGETIARFLDEGACELWFDNSKKLETTSTGTNVSSGANGTTVAHFGFQATRGIEIRTANSGAQVDATGIIDAKDSESSNYHAQLQFQLGGSTKASFVGENKNTFRMAAGTGGIQFGGDSSLDNALNDYEEGTYVPTLNSNLSHSSGSYNTFSYTKIGRSVTVRGLFYPGSWSGSDTVTVSLPFASANLTQISNAGGQGCMFRHMDGDYGTLAAYIDDNTSVMKFYRCQGNNTNWSVLNNSHFNTGSEFYVSVTYFAV